MTTVPIVLVIVAVILLLFYWKGPNPVWGSATLGLIVGLIVAPVTGEWNYLAYIFSGAIIAAAIYEWFYLLLKRLSKRWVE